MAKFRLRILEKFDVWADAATALSNITTVPKYVVIKKPTPKIVEYWVCVPMVGDQFDYVQDQLFNVESELKGQVADIDAAVADRANIVDGLILEMSNLDGTVDVYTDDDSYENNMGTDGAHRATEGWTPANQIKPSGQAFNDSQLGVEGADSKGFGNTLN
jgi:hypothetical protein